MLTLNQIKQLIVGWLNSHAQLNSVYYEDDFDFNAERNINYPVCNIEYIESNLNNKAMNHSFKITLADLINDNIVGIEDEIYSDMLQVAEDFFTWLQNFEGFEASKSTNIQKFVNDTGDRTAGIVFRIILSVIRPQNTCSKPQ